MNARPLLVCVLPLASCLALFAATTPSPLVLWYPQPARQWVEALPIGNGRMAAMVFGGAAEERLQLNEDTVWAGSPHNNNQPTAHDALPEIRRRIFAGDYAGASALAGEKIMPGVGKPNGMSLQPVGDLRLHFTGHENSANYRRELSLDDATVRIGYDVGNVHYTREIFTSLTDRVLVVHVTSSRNGALNFTADWSSPQLHSVRADPNETLVLAGTGPDHESIPGKVNFEAQLRVVTRDGKLDTVGANLAVTRASEATLLVAIGTNFVNYHDISADPAARARAALDAAQKKDFAALRAAHVAAYRAQFARVSLDVGASSPA